MKITPIARSNGAQESVNSGSSVSADKAARAKAVAAGQDPNSVESSNNFPKSALASPRAIKMNTQRTPAARDFIPEVATAEPVKAAPAAQNAAVSDNGEPASQATEVTKPVDPQIAEAQKRLRAVQVKETEIAKREAALAEKEKSGTTLEAEIKAEVDADPLGFLFKRGWDFSKLTEQVQKSMEGQTPALTKVEVELRKEIKGLKDALETRDKNQSDAQASATEESLNQLQKQADKMIAEDDAFQMIRETGSNSKVKELIKFVLDRDGEILEVTEALELVEADLIEQGLKFAKISKVQQQAQQTQVATTPVANNSARQTMRTLTNRDTVSSVPSAKDRAIAAFHGKKLV